MIWVDLKKAARWAVVAVLAMFLVVGGVLAWRTYARVHQEFQEVTDALVKLKTEYGLVDQEAESQRAMLKRVREQNHDLADQLDKANARVEGLITLNVTYKKENQRLKVKVADLVKAQEPGEPDRVNFHREFALATLDGWFTADRIDGPRESEFTLTPKPQEHTVIDTDQGVVAIPNDNATVTIDATVAKVPWWDGLGVFAGGGVGSGGGSGLIGVERRGFGVYIQGGQNAHIGVMKRWILGGRK